MRILPLIPEALLRILMISPFGVYGVMLYSSALRLERYYTLVIASKVRISDARVIVIIQALLVHVLLLKEYLRPAFVIICLIGSIFISWILNCSVFPKLIWYLWNISLGIDICVYSQSIHLRASFLDLSEVVSIKDVLDIEKPFFIFIELWKNVDRLHPSTFRQVWFTILIHFGLVLGVTCLRIQLN